MRRRECPRGARRDQGAAVQRRSRQTGTGSGAVGQLCGAHCTALQVAPKAAWSSSTRARGATRFAQVGKQQSASDVTGASCRTVVAQSVSAVHSGCEGRPASSGGGSAGAAAGLGATTRVGPLLADSPHAIAKIASRDESRIGRVTPRSMSLEPRSCSLPARHPDAR